VDLITFTHQIAISLHRVGLAGAAVDIAKFHELGSQWTQDAAVLKDKLTKYALRHKMLEFSPTNDSHVRELLYEKLKYPVLVKTYKDGLPAVNRPTLERLQEESKKSKWIGDFIAYNRADKLASTWYGKANPEKKHKPSVGELIAAVPGRDDLGLLHFWIFPLRARTGRRASGGGEEGDPDSRNSQNWPKPARKIIRSRWRDSRIAICDFSKLEVVIMGWRAKDEKLLEYFLNGEGYIGVAKEFWGQDVKKDTPLYAAIKSLVLGVGYGMGDWKMAEDLWYRAKFRFSDDWKTHLKQVTKTRRRYLKMFEATKRYIREQQGEVRDTQQVVSPTGRIRHLPHHGEPGFFAGRQDKRHWKHTLNSAINYPIQSFASDVTGCALVDYEREMLKEHKFSYVDWHRALLEHPHDLPASPVFNEVHDELDLDLHPKHGKRDLEILVDCMKNVRSLKTLVPGFNIKFKVDVQTVPTWGDAT
jgi:DNA polymerase I-like protein with 3'-5' exonuclease and polymerase domains